MKFLKRIFAPKEVRIVINVLNELSMELDSEACRKIRGEIEKSILGDYKNVVSQVKDGASASQLIYFSIANIAGDYVESGNYHIYRGVLNPLGMGNDLLSLFDIAVDRLLEEGAISEKEAKTQKTGIRRNIKGVG